MGWQDDPVVESAKGWEADPVVEPFEGTTAEQTAAILEAEASGKPFQFSIEGGKMRRRSPLDRFDIPGPTKQAPVVGLSDLAQDEGGAAFGVFPQLERAQAEPADAGGAMPAHRFDPENDAADALGLASAGRRARANDQAGPLRPGPTIEAAERLAAQRAQDNEPRARALQAGVEQDMAAAIERGDNPNSMAVNQLASGIGQQHQAIAGQMGALGGRQLAVMDKIDSGQPVAETDDPMGYLHMNPEQRRAARERIMEAVAASARNVAQAGKAMATIPREADADKMAKEIDSGDWKGAWQTFINNPLAITQQFSLESMPMSAPGMVAGLAGAVAGKVPGFMLGVAAGNYPMEYVAAFSDALQEFGVDVNNPQQVEEALKHPTVLKRIGDLGHRRGLTIAAVEAATARLIQPLARGAGVMKNAGKAALNVGIEAVNEPLGEFAAQVASGQEVKPSEIVAEFLGAGPQAVGSTIAATVAEGRDLRSPERIVADALNGTRFDVGLADVVADPAARKIALDKWREEGFAKQKAAMGEPVIAEMGDKSGELTQSSAITPAEPDKEAPGRHLGPSPKEGATSATSATGEGLSSELPIDESKALGRMAEQAHVDGMAMKRAGDGELDAKRAAIEEEEKAARVVVEVDSEKTAIRSAARLSRETGEPHQADQVGGKWVVTKEAPSTPPAAEADKKADITPEPPKKRRPAPTFASSSKYDVDTEDDGAFEATVHRTKDGGVVIVDARGGFSEYNKDFASGKSDEDLLRYDIAGFKGAAQRQEPAATVDAAAHEAATSPKNDLPEPTQAMKEAGNYKKGHVTVSGIDISIENPVGSTRSGVDANGRKWSNTMRTNYGYAKGTVGLDKDHLDFVIPEGTPQDFAGTVYVVNQNHANGRMDEHKIVLGAASEEEAKRLYLSNYTKGWESRIRSIVPMTMPEFKAWAYDKTESGPKGGEVKAKESANATAVDVPAPAAPAKGAGPATSETAATPPADDGGVSQPAESAVPAAEAPRAPAGAVADKDGKPRVWKTEKQAALWLKNNPQDGLVVQPGAGGFVVAQEKAAATNAPVAERDRLLAIYKREYETRYQDRPMDHPSSGAKRLVDAIESKDGFVLADDLNLTDAKANPVSRAVFEAATGVKLPAGVGASRDAIDKWAGITPEQREGRGQKRRVERDLKFATGFAEAKKFNVDGKLVTGKEYVDERIARGYTRLETKMSGAAAVYYLVNAAGDGFKLPHESLYKYARAAIAALPAESGVSDADVAAFNKARQEVGDKSFGEGEKIPEPKWWTDRTGAERVFVLNASGVNGTAQTPWNRISPADQRALDRQWGDARPETAAEQPKRSAGYKIVDSPREGFKMVVEPRGDGSNQNLAEFRVRGDGKAGKVSHFFESQSTRGPVEEAIAAWEAEQAPAAQFADNKVFTADKVAEARKRLKAKLGTLNSGIDPELLVDGMTIAGAYIESGARSFKKYSELMIADLGEAVKPYLLSFYEAVRAYPGLDKTGMNTPDEASSAHAALTAAAPGVVEQAIVGEMPKVKKSKKPVRVSDGGMKLTQDWGGEINGYGGDDERASGPIKRAFLAEAKKYLELVAEKLREAGFSPHLDRKGKPDRPVSVNESGVAGSGDVSLTMRKGDAGVYVTIGATSLRGVVPSTKQGVTIMARTTPDAGNDRYATKGSNQWLESTLTAAELAAWAEKRVSLIQPVVDIPKAEQNTKQEDDNNGQPLQPDNVPDAAPRADSGRGGRRGGRGKQVAPGLAGKGESPDRQGGLFGGPEGAGDAGAGAVREPERADAPGPARDSAGVRADDGAPGDVADFEITDATGVGEGGLKKKYRDNIAAIKILKELDEQKRVATPDEREAIARYVGWGGLKAVFDPNSKGWAAEHAELKSLLTEAEWVAARKSIRNAHYTSPAVVGAMWDAIGRLGFTSGRVLEPSVGVGNFFGLMPKAMRGGAKLFGVELDHLTSRIAAALYPRAQIAKSTGFQDYKIPSGYFDLAVGNPPFGSEPIVDDDRSPYSGFSIHNYFFAKSIDKLREGGLLVMVVSHSFLDRMSPAARNWIAQRAELVSAVRLPKTAFKENAGTEVVTDILVLRRVAERPVPKEDWLSTSTLTLETDKGESAKAEVNDYFLANPRNVLGRQTAAGSLYRANEYTVDPTGDLAEQLGEWVKGLPEGVYIPMERGAEMEAADVVLPDGVKVGTFFIGENGAVMQRAPDALGKQQAVAWVAPSDMAEKRMRAMIPLREALRGQMRLEKDPLATEADVESGRKELNKLYDAFVREFGFVNSQVNRRVFLDDPEAPLLQALEVDYDKGLGKTSKAVKEDGAEPREPFAKKADILKRRVLFPPNENLVISSAKDALIASLNYKGRMDVPYMEGLYGKSGEEIIAELGDVVYIDPQDGPVTADEYLSGDVKTKLEEAKAAAESDGKFARNVAALEKVIPADLMPSQIFASPGAAWIDRKDYEAFLKEVTGHDSVAIHYIAATASWAVHAEGTPDAGKESAEYGTSRIGATKLFTELLNGKAPIIYDRLPDDTRVVNKEATEAANERQNKIREKWNGWIWADSDRSTRLAKVYNEKHNRVVERQFDGSHMTFPGMTPAIQLRKSQKDSAWRGLQDRQVLMDHVVGAGKTFAGAALAMEFRRLAVARKPLFIVPNHLTLSWRQEFYRLYPTANVLVALPEDFTKDNRRRLFSKIATGDWDSVIIGHSSLKKIGLPAATEAAIVGEQLAELAAGIEELKRERGDRNLIRDMEKIKANLEAKMKKRQQQVGTRDDVVSFDELGVDAVFMDEFHEFKNLFFTTQKQRVAGMGNPEGSAKAFDLFVKIRWLFETFGQKAPLVTMTGTPVSNSLAEMFTVQRYMQYAQLKRDGLHLFDAWAKMFGDDQNVYEVSPSGVGYRVSQRFARFKNLPALMGMYRGFADVITMDDLKQQAIDEGKVFPVPKIAGGRPQIIVAKKSPMQNQYIGEPELARTPDGDIEFEAPVEKEPEIEQGKDGRWMVRTSRWSASFATEEEAREGYATKALTPVIGFNKPSLLDQFANLRDLTRQTKGRINALSLTNLANKVALDYRLIEPGAADFAGSKVNESVKHMLRIYKKWSADKGTQLVFCDLSVPLSARKRLAAKEARVYIRDDQGALTHARGTVNSVEGFEGFPFYLIPRGKGATKTIDMHDPVSGARIRAGIATREEARTWAAEFLGKEENREKWLDYRDSKPAISDEELEDYKNANDFDEESGNEITGADLEGMASATAFSIYDDIKAKLVAQGVPEREIAFIHDFDTPKAKMELFKRVNRGEVRILLGSTPKLGAGTNVQERVVALHHIDAPWRPSDLEQREGRAVRQGNKLYERDPDGFEVEILRYATEQTYDTRRWQILEHKAAGIEQLRKYGGELETEDVSSEAANAAEMKAAASGSPLILKETELRTEVRRLEALRNAHQDEQYVIKNRISYLMESVARAPKRIAKVERALATIEKHPETKGEFTPLTVDGREITARNDAIAVLTSFVNKVIAGEAREVPMVFRGLDLKIHRVSGSLYVSHDDLDNVVAAYTPDYRTKQFDFSPAGLLTRLENYTRDRLPASLEQSRGYVVKDEKEIAELTPRLGKVFEEQGRLDAARTEHADVQRRLMKENIATAIRPKDREAVNAAIADRREALDRMGFGDALKSMDSDAPRLSRPASDLPRSTSGQGLTRGAVQDIATALGSDAEVLASAKSLPANLYTFLKRSGADTIARGMYDPESGRVFVFADKIGSAELAAFVILHESAHRGLRRTFGDGLDPILREIYKSNATVRTKANMRRAKYKESIERATEEVIADMALRGVARNLSGWQKFVAFVREWLAERGIRIAWTDAMVEYLAGAAAQAGKVSTPAVFTDADARMMNVAPPLWYSELAVRIAGAKQETMPGAQWKAWLTNQQGLKADEIEWSGIKDWLGTQGAKVTKQQILDYLHAGGVKVEETMLSSTFGGPRPRSEVELEIAQQIAREHGLTWDDLTEEGRAEYLEEARTEMAIEDAGAGRDTEEGQTKFASYQLPGGQNYRELLLTLPAASAPEPMYKTGADLRARSEELSALGWSPAAVEASATFMDEAGGNISTAIGLQDALVSRGYGYTQAQRDAGGVLRAILGGQKKREVAALSQQFRSSHFDTPNILAHVRFNERTDSEGRKILFIEEIQSDFGQKTKRVRDAISSAVDGDFEEIVRKMKAAGVLEVECD